MISSLRIEEIRKDRLALASVLAGNPSNIGFSAAEPSVILHESGGIKLKATFRRADADAHQDVERLYIATDAPNFQRWEPETGYHRHFMELNLDALLIAWCDPSKFMVPISYTQGVWQEVELTPGVENDGTNQRFDTYNRDVLIHPPNRLDDDFGSEPVVAGSLEFPFSTMMIRELVMSYWHAFFEDASQFYQHCGSCKRSVTEEMSFSDKWSISFDGTCKVCGAIEIDLSAAVPTDW